jgi:hypothetical protein
MGVPLARERERRASTLLVSISRAPLSSSNLACFCGDENRPPVREYREAPLFRPGPRAPAVMDRGNLYVDFDFFHMQQCQ